MGACMGTTNVDTGSSPDHSPGSSSGRGHHGRGHHGRGYGYGLNPYIDEVLLISINTNNGPLYQFMVENNEGNIHVINRLRHEYTHQNELILNQQILNLSEEELALLINSPDFMMNVMIRIPLDDAPNQGLSATGRKNLKIISYVKDIDAENNDENINANDSNEDEDEYSKVKKLNSAIIQECYICQETYNVGEKIYKLPCNCTSLCHVTCLDRWFEKSSKCPMCKLDINTVPLKA